jgi:hypothetical protein
MLQASPIYRCDYRIARWQATADVARRFRNGRVFLAGMPPT